MPWRWRRIFWKEGSKAGNFATATLSLADFNYIVVLAADSMLRRAKRAQAGSRRLHDQADTRGFGESDVRGVVLKRGIKRQSRQSGVRNGRSYGTTPLKDRVLAYAIWK